MKLTVMCFILLGASKTFVHSLDSYRAAVYEHNVTFPADRTKILPRDEALQVMKKNLVVYSQQAKLASDKEARIIVFPEYGLFGLGWTRQTIAPYLEYIPDPKSQTWNPCDKPAPFNSTEIQHMLSCMAKDNSLYIVANMGARQPCTISDPKCPIDHQYQYSANVVYGPNGDFLARYFKFNLYSDEKQFDKPEQINLTTFETPFGRFGTFSSLDIMYHDPAITLIEKMNITNIAYPTAWIDELPLLSAIEFHSAFAEGMHVNLLAANLHLPSAGYHGSGLYWPTGTSIDGMYYYNDSLASNGSLVVGTFNPFIFLESNDTRTKSLDALSVKSEGIRNKAITVKINGDLFTAILTRDSYGKLHVCQGSLCCDALFEGEFSSELYAFGAFDGIHTEGDRYYLQACVFIKCANNTPESCGTPTKVSSSYMSKMSFYGNFTTKYVFPEVLVTENGVLELVTRYWLYQNAVIIDVGLYGSPLSISIFSRDYSHDN
ncbi:hypothetical protein CHS0354_040902 [Potamilus streckersoni]|uniref:CN hydrolase domain-containing protein n=1 Tax=Potamilus streckersoni TaxID=2493646 RepID=A0AAE0SLW2_9BIVA|nr:hypothetical protein CHS0354_040902 [Potamilus streckersoni]